MSIGSSIRAAREAKGLDPHQLAEDSHTTLQIVQDFENDDFSNITASIYGQGYLKLICEQLGMDPEPILAEFKRIYVPRGHEFAPYGSKAYLAHEAKLAAENRKKNPEKVEKPKPVPHLFRDPLPESQPTEYIPSKKMPQPSGAEPIVTPISVSDHPAPAPIIVSRSPAEPAEEPAPAPVSADGTQNDGSLFVPEASAPAEPAKEEPRDLTLEAETVLSAPRSGPRPASAPAPSPAPDAPADDESVIFHPQQSQNLFRGFEGRKDDIPENPKKGREPRAPRKPFPWKSVFRAIGGFFSAVGKGIASVGRGIAALAEYCLEHIRVLGVLAGCVIVVLLIILMIQGIRSLARRPRTESRPVATGVQGNPADPESGAVPPASSESAVFIEQVLPPPSFYVD